MGVAMVHIWVKSPRNHTEIARVSPVETTESGSFILYKTYLNPHVTEYVSLYMSYPSSHVHKKFIILFWVLIEFRLVVGKECGRWGSLVALPSDQGRWDSLMALGTMLLILQCMAKVSDIAITVAKVLPKHELTVEKEK